MTRPAYAHRVRIDVVGTPTVSSGAGTVSGAHLGGRRAHVVLTALALEGPLSSDHLAERVWEQERPTTWPAALRGVVRSLRASLEPIGGGGQEVITTQGSGYALAAGVEVDVRRAEDRLEQAVDAIRATTPRAALGLLREPSRLRGPALLPEEPGGWLGAHRDHVDALAARALSLLAETASSLEDHDVALAAARAHVALSPLDERAHRTLVLVLTRAGDRAGAVRAFEVCREVLAEELGVDPSTETVEVYTAALGEQSLRTTARVPRASTSFRGREEEVQRLAAAIADPGLVTLTGPGGVGKSRLAAEAVGRGESPPGGRLWIPLEPVTQDALVASTVALVAGIPPTEDATRALVGELSPRGRTLLVLDGCEQAVDGVASLVADLLAGCPGLTVLVTSRRPLDLAGERVVALAPWNRGALVGLLRDRVRESGAEMSADTAAGPAVERLVSRCGGLPLAVELLAAQLGSASAADLADQLDELLPAAGGPLRAVIGSSYALLSAEEATVFRRFSVLDGGVGLALVRAVVSDEAIPPLRVIRILSRLADQGLLTINRTGERWRYTQDDELHRYARELLAERDGEAEGFARLASAVHAMLPEDPRAAPGTFQAALTDVLDSVRALFGAAVEGRADHEHCLELAFRLHRYFASTNVSEGRFWLARLLEDPPADSGWTAYATFALGYLDYWTGASDEAVPHLRQAVDLLTGVDEQYVARSLIFLAGLLDDLDQGSEAIELVRRAIEVAEPFGAVLLMPTVMGLGSVLSERGDPEAAEHAERAVGLVRDTGSPEQLAMALPTAAMICWQVGAHEQAQAYVDLAMPLHEGTTRISRVVLLTAAAGLALAAGEVERAIDLARTSDTEGTELGVGRELPLARAVLARALLASGDRLDAADRASAALEVGLSIAFDAALAIGLETSVLVLGTDGARPEERSALLAAAAAIRGRGDRPAPASLRDARLDVPSGASADGRVPDLRDAARLAQKLLAELRDQ